MLLNDYDSTFDELLHRNEEVTIHVKRFAKTYVRGIQMYYLWQPLFLWEFFNRKMLPYNLRINDLLKLPETRTSRYGNESLSFWGSMVWNRLPDIYKAAKSCYELRGENQKSEGIWM